MRYRIRGISVWAAAQTGFVFGLLMGALPSAITMLVIQFFAHGYSDLLHKTDVDIVPGFNLADKLGLRETITAAGNFDKGLTYILIFLGGILFTGVLLGGLAALSAWMYNHLPSGIGGLDVTLEPVAPAAASQAMPMPAPAIPLGPADRSGAVQLPVPPPAWAVVPPTVAASPGAAPAAPSLPRLCLSSNPGQAWPINKPTYLIGSAPGCDLSWPVLQLQHARIEFDPAARGYVLTDLSNGQTWVNDRPVAGRHKLLNGFRVRFGTLDLLFYL